MKKLYLFFSIFLVFISIHISARTWSALTRLTWNTWVSWNPSITADPGTGLHVVWQEYGPASNDIFYKYSADRGVTWAAPTRITWNPGSSGYPAIASDISSWIHLVWEDSTPGQSEIFYRRWNDSESNWSAITRLTWSSGSSDQPSIAVDTSSAIHVAWCDNSSGNYEIYYKCGADRGDSWGRTKRLTWTSGDSVNPSIAADTGNGVHVVWMGDTSTSYEIFYKRSTDSGTTWFIPTRLTWIPTHSMQPQIAADSTGGIHVIWENSVQIDKEIFYKRSTDNGTTWSISTRLTWNSGDSWKPSIAVDSGSGVHVVWSDDTPGSADAEIYYKQSADSGATWLGISRLTWNTGNSTRPWITADPNNDVHVVWEDESFGNSEILYKNHK